MRHLNKKSWPFQIYVICDSYSGREKIDDWCSMATGKQSSDWFSFNTGSTTTYAFKDQKNLFAFKLTWGGKEYGI